jgi:hypothetical protein
VEKEEEEEEKQKKKIKMTRIKNNSIYYTIWSPRARGGAVA